MDVYVSLILFYKLLSGGDMMRFTAKVKTDEGEWIDMPIRVILLDEQGQPDCVVGATGLQYREFELQEVE